MGLEWDLNGAMHPYLYEMRLLSQATAPNSIEKPRLGLYVIS